MASLISQFRIGQDSGGNSVRRELQKVAPHAFQKAAAPVRAPSHKPQPKRTAQKRVANGASRGDDGEWMEF